MEVRSGLVPELTAEAPNVVADGRGDLPQEAADLLRSIVHWRRDRDGQCHDEDDDRDFEGDAEDLEEKSERSENETFHGELRFGDREYRTV